MDASDISSTSQLDLVLGNSQPIYSRIFKPKQDESLQTGIRNRIVLSILLTWVPLVVLCAVQDALTGASLLKLFLLNFVQSVRFLLVIPLLIMAESQIRPWVTHVVRYFLKSGMVPPDQVDTYIKIVERAQKKKNSIVPEIIMIVLAFGSSIFGVSFIPQADFGSWHHVGTQESWAGLWHHYLALPLFRLAWASWGWRLLIWCSLLFRISRLHLQLVPTHPDNRGGLGFLAAGHSNFAILVFALSCQISAVMGEDILYYGNTMNQFKATILLIIILVIGISLIPLALFTPKLLECKRLGLYQYGILAKQYLDSYHTRWVHEDGAIVDETVISETLASDPKSQDSFKSVGNMQITVFDKGTISAFAMAAAAPFTPLLLTIYRFDQLLDQVLKKLL